MKIFIAFLAISYLSGMLFRKASPRLRSRLLLGMALLIPVAFYFFNKL